MINGRSMDRWPTNSSPGKKDDVRYLDLSFTFVTTGAGVLLSQMTGLEIVHLAFTRHSSRVLEYIGELENLTVLDLMGTNILEPDPSLLSIRSRLSSLECLDLSFNSIKDKDLHALSDLKALRILNLVNTDITDDDIEMIKNIQSLRRLYLSRNRISDDGVRTIGKMSGPKPQPVRVRDHGPLCRLPFGTQRPGQAVYSGYHDIPRRLESH
jgi:hypothetical protein